MRPRVDARSRGEIWEARAAELLRENGIRIVAQRYRCRLGELDIIGADGSALVIIEVRARGGRDAAIETIGIDKRRRIVNATRHFLMQNPEWSSHRIRFDVVAIDHIDSDEPEIRWVRNAFDAA